MLSSCALDKNSQDTRYLVVATSQELADAGFIAAITPKFEAAQNVRIKWLTVSSCQALNYINHDSRIDVLLISGGNQLDKPIQSDQDFCKFNTDEASTPSALSGALAGPGPTYPAYDAPVTTPTPQPTLAAGVPPLPTPTALDVKYLLAERQTIFWSQLALVGPASDPLHLDSAANIAKALKTLGEQNGHFLLAGQEPGLVDLQEAWWRQVTTGDRAARGSNYKVFDGDFQETLAAAETSGSYTIVPLDILLNSKQNSQYKIIFDKDISMYLPYEAMVHNSTRCNSCDLQLARTFIEYLNNSNTQEIISNLGKTKFNTTFFRPFYFHVYHPQ